MKLVELVGTQKQIAWANSIRENALKVSEIRNYFRYIENESSASFWIDNRFDFYSVIKARAAKEYKASLKNLTKSEIFKKAHALAKKIKAAHPEVNYSAEFSLCLKLVYSAVKEAKAA